MPAAQCEELRTRRSAAKGRAGPSATISTGPLHHVGPALTRTPLIIGITVTGIAEVGDRQASGGDDHDRHQGAFPEDMVC